MAGDSKLKASKSQAQGAKKAYGTFQNNASPAGLITHDQMGSIAKEATQQLL
jgi:hypothetical protein